MNTGFLLVCLSYRRTPRWGYVKDSLTTKQRRRGLRGGENINRCLARPPWKDLRDQQKEETERSSWWEKIVKETKWQLACMSWKKSAKASPAKKQSERTSNSSEAINASNKWQIWDSENHFPFSSNGFVQPFNTIPDHAASGASSLSSPILAPWEWAAL